MASATYNSFLIGYALLAAALLAGLYLFFSLKRDIQMAARKQERRVEAIAERLREAEEPLLIEAGAGDPGGLSFSAMAYPSSVATVRAGFNLNKRVQAMRLLRRGENISHIAAVLGVPLKEVELLIRVQQMTALGPATAPAAKPRVLAAAAGAGAGGFSIEQ